ncbi:MAG: ThuA domain-containing protein [Fibrobacteria bacterium]
MKSVSLRSALLSATLLASFALSVQAQTEPLAKRRVETIGGKSYQLTSKLKSILVSSFFFNFNHKDGIPNMTETLQRIGAAEGWKVDIVASSGDVTATKLKDYQVFFGNYISSWATSGSWSAASRTAMQDFVEKDGKGMFVMHGSGDSKAGGPWSWFYSTAHPVIYTGELYPWVPAPVVIPDNAKTHPIMEGVAMASNSWSGEWHKFSKLITNIPGIKAQVLFSMDGKNCAGCGKGSTSTFIGYDVDGGYPASWTFPAGKGNIGYFMEGHDKATMTTMGQANWDKFFRNFMYHMAGYDTVLAGTSLIKSPEKLSLDASGVSFHSMDEPGVYINKPGSYSVSLFDVSGHVIKQVRGNVTPVDYDFESELKNVRKGIYVMRVVVPGGAKSKRFLVN